MPMCRYHLSRPQIDWILQHGYGELDTLTFWREAVSIFISSIVSGSIQKLIGVGQIKLSILGC